MKHFNVEDIGIVNHEGSAIRIAPTKSILLTTDILTYNRREDTPYLEVGHDPSRLAMGAESTIIESFSSTLREGQTYSTVYGERLIEILEWIIGVLKTHSHGPNAPAIPDFHPQANSYEANMTNYLLNRNVRTR